MTLTKAEARVIQRSIDYRLLDLVSGPCVQWAPSRTREKIADWVENIEMNIEIEASISTAVEEFPSLCD